MTPPVAESLPVAPIAPLPTSTAHLDDHPSTPFYGQEHGVHVTPSSHVGIFVTI